MDAKIPRLGNPGLKALAQFVSEVMKEQNLSTYDVERRSRGQVSHGTVHNLIKLKVKKEVRADTIAGLALALGKKEDQLWELYRSVNDKAAGQFEQRVITLPVETWDTLELILDAIRKGRKLKP